MRTHRRRGQGAERSDRPRPPRGGEMRHRGPTAEASARPRSEMARVCKSGSTAGKAFREAQAADLAHPFGRLSLRSRISHRFRSPRPASCPPIHHSPLPRTAKKTCRCPPAKLSRPRSLPCDYIRRCPSRKPSWLPSSSRPATLSSPPPSLILLSCPTIDRMPHPNSKARSSKLLSSGMANRRRRTGTRSTRSWKRVGTFCEEWSVCRCCTREEVRDLYTAMIPAQQIQILEPLDGTCAVCSLKS